MLTKQEVMEIVSYCREHSVTYQDRLAEIGISKWEFYRSKSHYKKEESLISAETGQFIQLGQSGAFVPDNITAMEGKHRPKYGPKTAGDINIECRTPRGGLLRLSGTITAETLAVLVQNL